MNKSVLAVLIGVCVTRGAVAEPLKIIGFETGNGITFSGATVGNYYTLEFAQTLNGPWTNWGSVTEQPITGSVMHSPSPFFYRIRQTDSSAFPPYAPASHSHSNITSSMLVPSAVQTPNIADGSVTTEKLAPAAVTDANVLSVSGEKVFGNINITGDIWAGANIHGENGVHSGTEVGAVGNVNAGSNMWAGGDIRVEGSMWAGGDIHGEKNISVNGAIWAQDINATRDLHIYGSIGSDGNIGSSGLIGADGGFFTTNNVQAMTILAQQDVGAGGNMSADGNMYASAFIQTSDRNLKEKFESIDSHQILDRVSCLPISRWSFKGDSSTRHIGPMAQDFSAAFGVGEDDTHIATVDQGGVALAAIQGLHSLLKDKDAEIADLKRRLANLETLVFEQAGNVP